MGPVVSEDTMANNKMCRLTYDQLHTKTTFIKNYIDASNAATGSTFDANANVTNKNVGTLFAEINKDINIQLKRAIIYDYIQKDFGIEIADEYIRQLEAHEIYAHDETAFCLPYCVAVDMSPFIENGLTVFGGETKAPKHLSSYNGGYINLIFALSSQFAGAVATPAYLYYFHYFALKEYGPNYLQTHEREITQTLQETIYAINQPASARGMQSAFTNWSIFDKYYFETMFGSLIYPDGSKCEYEEFNKLQMFFMRWFNKERTKALLTFPVVTVAMLNDGKTCLDKDMYHFVAKELHEGNSFFIYTSDSVDSLSSCCRLRNGIKDQLNDFSYSLGAGGIMTGSMNVLTLNMNRFIQNVYKEAKEKDKVFKTYLMYRLEEQIYLMHKWQIAIKKYFQYLESKGMLPAYTGKFINLDKQYLTIGINGLLEGAEFLGYSPTNNPQYIHFISSILFLISECNKITTSTYPDLKLKLNTEIVPAETLGVKFAKWDKQDNYVVPRDCYNSYFYRVEDDELSIFDKLVLQGDGISKSCDGGSACHINLEEYPTAKVFERILDEAVKAGCPYFCFNVKVTICNECGFINKHTKQYCINCGSTNIDYGTRIIGLTTSSLV